MNLELIRRHPATFAPGETVHLVQKVLAYCADEAESAGRGRATVTVHTDRSVTVAD